MEDTSDNHTASESEDIASKFEIIKERAVLALRDALADSNDIDPRQKFEAALNILRYSPDPEAAQIALDSVFQIQDKADRFDLLNQLINEVLFIQNSLKKST